MKKLLLSVLASFMLLAMPNLAFAAGRSDDNDGNAMRPNQFVNRVGDLDDDGLLKKRNYTQTTNEINRTRAYNTNDRFNDRMTTRNWNTDWDNNNYRANAVDDDTDWGWLGLLGLIGLAGIMGRGRDRGDVK